MTTRVPLFCDVPLARRIERAEADLISAVSSAAHRRRGGDDGFLLPIAGGIASFADAGSPYNKVVGLGFAGVPEASRVEVVERAFADRGEPTQVELAHLADPGLGALLTSRGYRLDSFENVLGRAVGSAPPPDTADGIDVRPSGADEFDTWLRVVADAAASPDTQGVPWHEEFPHEVYRLAQRDAAEAGLLRYAAFRRGELAGGATMRITDGIAQLTGAATAPRHRRRGIQSALLDARLRAAAEAGCDLAVVVAQPGSKSQQNAQRRGFALLYTRAVLVRQPAPPVAGDA